MKIYIIHITKLILIFCILVILLTLGANNLESVQSSIDVFTNHIFPSLFPFILFTEYIIQTNLLKTISTNENFTVILIGFLCGFPSAAKVIAHLYDNNKIDINKVNFLLSFTNNASPIYILTTIGISLFNDIFIGIILLISHILSSILIGLISFLKYRYNIIHQNEVFLKTNKEKKHILHKIDDFEVIKKGIKNTFITMSFILGFMIIFNLLSDTIITILNLQDEILKGILTGIFELGKGITKISKLNNGTLSIILISFVLSFSSISVIFQIKSCFKKNISIIRLILYKLSHGILSCIITYILLTYIFNESISVYEDIYNNIVVTNTMHNTYIIIMSSIIFILSTFFVISYFKSEKKYIKKLY